jgi:S1-C subfamily serine protease
MPLLRLALVTLLTILGLIGVNWLVVESTNIWSFQAVAGGLAASQARFLSLTARKSELEMQGQAVNQYRIALANTLATLMDQLSQVDPKSEEAKRLSAQISKLQEVDKRLEVQLRRIDTQLQAVQTEINAAQRIIDRNIDISFKTFDGGAPTPPATAAAAYNELGSSMLAQGRLEEAIKQFEQALELDPNLVRAQNNLKEAERLLAARDNPTPPLVNDIAWVPKPEVEPWASTLRSVVRITANLPGGPEFGTGWIVKREGNQAWLVTNRHVVQRYGEVSKALEIEFYSEPPHNIQRLRLPAEVVQCTSAEDSLDLAVLKITGIPEDIQAMAMVSSRPPRGLKVKIIGHPTTGDPWSLVSGEIVGANSLQLPIDANVAEGNSGSPVLDEEGRVVGIIFSVKPFDSKSETVATGGFSYAYPASMIREKLSTWGIL